MPWLVRANDDVLPSRVAWPFTTTGSLVSCGIVAGSIGAVTVWLETCQASPECTASKWTDESIWGPPRYNQTEYCETLDATAFMQQHANSMSNLVFCAGGLMIFLCGVGDMVRIRSIFAAPTDAPFHVENHTILCPLYSMLLGLASILMGAFSFMFHAHNTRFTQQLDVGAIFIVLNVVIVGAFQLLVDPDLKRSGLLMFRFILLVVAFGASYLMTYYKYSINTTDMMLCQLAVVAFCILLAVFRRSRLRRGRDDRLFFRGWRYAIASFLSLGLGYGMRQLGVSKKACIEDSVWQFHAFWHALCAASIFFIYLFYRSERMHKPKYIREHQILPSTSRSSTRGGYRDSNAPVAPVVYVDAHAHTLTN